MILKGNFAVACVLVFLLELTSLAQGQQCSTSYQAIPGPPGRDGRDGKDGSPGVFTHEDFLKLKEMLINEGVCCSQNSSTPSPCRTVTQTVTTTQVAPSESLCPTPTPSPVPTVTETEYLTMNQTVTSTQVVHSTATCPTPTPEVSKDCRDLQSKGFNQSGVYTIQPDSLPPFDVSCDMDTDGGGWTVLQRRQDGSVDFYRNWDNYTAGFGNLSGEFWLGLNYTNRITNASSFELRVDLADFDNETRYAKYSSFRVSDASIKYVLTVSGYSGTAGDCLVPHNGRAFSTFDQDNDNDWRNCATTYKGAWWYASCYESNLNGLYLRGTGVQKVIWKTWRGGQYSLKFTEMKVRPSN